MIQYTDDDLNKVMARKCEGPGFHSCCEDSSLLAAEVARCREIAERDGKDYSELLQGHHSLCGKIEELKDDLRKKDLQVGEVRELYKWAKGHWDHDAKILVKLRAILREPLKRSVSGQNNEA